VRGRLDTGTDRLTVLAEIEAGDDVTRPVVALFDRRIVHHPVRDAFTVVGDARLDAGARVRLLCAKRSIDAAIDEGARLEALRIG
jgi:hypothetical protein